MDNFAWYTKNLMEQLRSTGTCRELVTWPRSERDISRARSRVYRAGFLLKVPVHTRLLNVYYPDKKFKGLYVEGYIEYPEVEDGGR